VPTFVDRGVSRDQDNKPFEMCRIDDIPGFIIKGYSVILIPTLRHIFNLSLTQQYFSAAWKEAAVVPVFKRGNHAAMSYYRPISILNNFSKLFEFIIHYNFRIMLNLIQIGTALPGLNQHLPVW
jgi:hypothetical protein